MGKETIRVLRAIRGAGGSIEPKRTSASRTTVAERLSRRVRLLEDLRARGDLYLLRAAEQRFVREELIELEIETSLREIDETLDRITNGDVADSHKESEPEATRRPGAD